MADDNLVLEHLRAIRDTLGQHGRKLDDLGYRMTSVEKQLADIRGDMANDRAHRDSLEQRIERIERRLELLDDA